MKRTPLKRRKGINKISDKRRAELLDECEVRALLCARAGGVLEDGVCCGGHCELCHQLPDFRGLQMHHKKFRSHCGKTDLDNCEYICGKCHDKKHGLIETQEQEKEE